MINTCAGCGKPFTDDNPGVPFPTASKTQLRASVHMPCWAKAVSGSANSVLRVAAAAMKAATSTKTKKTICDAFGEIHDQIEDESSQLFAGYDDMKARVRRAKRTAKFIEDEADEDNEEAQSASEEEIDEDEVHDLQENSASLLDAKNHKTSLTGPEREIASLRQEEQTEKRDTKPACAFKRVKQAASTDSNSESD